MSILEKNDGDIDCRAIKKEFLEKFIPEESGEEENDNYKVFLELVKKYSDELVLCFRGNNKGSEAVCIYYNNHLVYKIEYKHNDKNNTDEEKITINFDHARYSPEYRNFWKKITRDYGFIPTDNRREEEVPKVTVRKDGGSYNTTVGEITARLNEDVLKNVENIYYNCLRPMLIDSFDLLKTTDQFRVTANKYAKYRSKITQTRRKRKSNWIEKIRQQQLFCEMKSTQNGLFVFDMEFSQKSMEDAEMCEQAVKNQPDMLAIRFENGCPIAYVLVEVKSTKKACGGESGIEKHLMAMEQYRKGCNMQARYREAALIISHYKELGLYQLPQNIEEEDYMKLPVEILFIFTDEAVSVFEKDTELRKRYEPKEPENMKEMHLPCCKQVKIVQFEKK